MTLNFDCVVVGAGIAGMTAAIYLKRANLNVLIIEKSAFGGQLNWISHIANYPGFSSIDGPTLATNLLDQIHKLEIECRYGNVLAIKNEKDKKVIITDQETIFCKAVILATGRIPKELGIEKERQLIGKGISRCAVCDGFFYKDKEVAVIGGGNSALEEGLYLADICKKVYLIHRSSTFRGDSILVDKVKQTENINIYDNATICSIQETDGKLSGITIRREKDFSLDISGLFIYIGYEPDTQFLKDTNIELQEHYILTSQEGRTNIPFIYACGDVIKKSLYQLTTAVGEGSIAASSAIADLKQKYSQEV